MDKNYKFGIIYGLSAYFLWGVLPIYWKLLGGVSSYEILAGRCMWSCVFVFLLILGLNKLEALKAELKILFSGLKTSLSLLAAAVTVSVNWGIFIWAVNDGRIVETSMGYYINPLVSVLFAVVLLGERLDRLQLAAVAAAVVGVGLMVWKMGTLPWVSLSLAVSFALYGLIKKCLALTPLSSIFLETLMVTPIAIVYEYNLYAEGTSAYQTMSNLEWVLMLGAGVVTAIPLLLFTAGAQLLPLKIMGFLQYTAPTISLLVGIFVYNEPFTSNHLLSFGWIWFGLGLFILSQIRKK